MKDRHHIPLAAMERLLKEAGAERVSESAKEALRNILEEYSATLCRDANTFAEHAKRKTIKGEDLKLALASKRT